ncbi:MAG TPA: RluA family pseudouridine synthase [Methylibium sp.]|nr:RluA family pseudouridine synthase [Methylibium sp.]
MTACGIDVPLYADAALLVVVKPAGLLAVPGRGADKQDCLSARLQRRWPGARIVHRLDEATSGLMVFALDLPTQRALGRAFEHREVDKGYVAVVAGRVAATAGVIDLPIGADWADRPRRRIDPAGGRPALTRWRVLAQDATTTRLALEPLTGRTHQLRVHLAALGHPIVGDRLYGGPPADRLRLHASLLAFVHPVDGGLRTYDSPPPF